MICSTLYTLRSKACSLPRPSSIFFKTWASLMSRLETIYLISSVRHKRLDTLRTAPKIRNSKRVSLIKTAPYLSLALLCLEIAGQ